MQISGEVADIVNRVFSMAESAHFEYVTPELFLYVICQNRVFARAFESCGGSIRELDQSLRTYVEEYMELRPEDQEGAPELSSGMESVLALAWNSAQGSGRKIVELPHILFAFYGLRESHAVYYMRAQGVEQAELLQEMAIAYEEEGRAKGAGESKQENCWQQ